MAYLELSDTSLVSQNIRKKIDFYVQSNLFPIREKIEKEIKYKNLNNTDNQIISSIKKCNKDLLKQINFLYLNDASDWNVICICDPKNPLIILNFQQISQDYKNYSQAFDGVREAIAYATIFGFLGIYFGANLCFSCFGALRAQGDYTTSLYERYEFLAQHLFDHYKDDFMIFMTSTDKGMNQIFMFGKKYIFTISILFSEERIDLQQVASLLDLSEEDSFVFLSNYKNVAYIAFMNYKVGADV